MDLIFTNDSMKAGAYQMKNEKLCLIGCGWLGLALAKHLIAAQYHVLATTAQDKTDEFKVDGIPYMPFDISANETIPDIILNSDIIIYLIPPLELAVVKNFFDKFPPNKKIIFTSSTSIYGKNLGFVHESFKPDIHHTNSPLLLQTEEYMHERFSNLTIIRPGGLYGDKRHPVYFLQGKKNLTTGQELLHLVHREDVVQGILSILEGSIWGETFNLVSDLRVPKKEYYINMATKLGLIAPEYIQDENAINPTALSNEKSKLKLKINYFDPNQF